MAKEDGTTETISTKNVILATGSEPAALPGVDVDEETIVTSTGALDLKEVSSFFLLSLFAHTNFVFFRQRVRTVRAGEHLIEPQVRQGHGGVLTLPARVWHVRQRE